MDKPSWIFWEEWNKNNNEFPPSGSKCPRCGQYMDGGFWMHLCPDTIKYLRKSNKKLSEEELKSKD